MALTESRWGSWQWGNWLDSHWEGGGPVVVVHDPGR